MKDFPVIKFTIFFAAGIILNLYFDSTIQLDLILLGSLFIILAVVYLIEKRTTFFGYTSMLIFFTALLIGYTAENFEQKGKIFLPDSVYVLKNFTACGTIENISLPGQNGFSFLLKSDSVNGQANENSEIRFLCNVSSAKNRQLFDEIHPGYVVKVCGTYRKGREERNPGEFDYNEYLHLKNISGSLSLNDNKDIEIVSADLNPLQSLVFNARKTIDSIITELHTNQTSALLKGLILADRRDISYETKNQFINAGVIHILAVSGLHVGFIALIFYMLLGRFNLHMRSIITIVGILLFMFLTGVPTSVFRAAVMSVVILLAYMLNRTTNIYNSLAVAALVILTITPSDLYSPGFQLSFAAVLSIGYFSPLLRKQILKLNINSSLLNYLLFFTAVSVSAQIGTLPFTLYYFGRLSVFALLTNIVVIPLTAVIIGTLILTLGLFPLFHWAASVYAAANNLFSYLLFRIVEFTGSLNFSVMEFKNYSVLDALIFCIFLATGILLFNYLKSAKSKIIFVLLILSNIILYSTFDDSEILAKNKLNVFMIDVGQGDSFLIKFPDGETALIDAGNATPFFDNGERIILPLLDQLGIHKIDYGFISHIDSDHYGGFFSLIEHGKIKRIFKPLPDLTIKKDILFENYLRTRYVDVEYYSKRLIRAGNSEIFILNDKIGKSELNSSNNASGILMIRYGKNSFLFTGDLEERGENYYREKYGDFLDADVLKVGHHGSRTSSSPDFIQAVSPQICLISCGIKNKYNNPSPDIISRLTMNNSRIFRTDKEGGILLQSDGVIIEKIDWRNYY